MRQTREPKPEWTTPSHELTHFGSPTLLKHRRWTTLQLGKTPTITCWCAHPDHRSRNKFSFYGPLAQGRARRAAEAWTLKGDLPNETKTVIKHEP